MRVCYFGTFDPRFARNALLIAGLREAGVEIVECRAPLWRDTADKVASARGGAVAVGRRVATAWRALRAQYRHVGHHDVVVVGYAGHLDIWLARALARQRGCPVVLDAFLGLSETVEDRHLARQGFPRWRAARAIDCLAARRADRVLLDSAAHAVWLARLTGVAPGRVAVVPMGAWPRAPLPAAPPRPFEVVYFGGYIPLHGLDHVLDAARALSELPDVRFTLVGDGQEFGRIQQRAAEMALANVRFAREWLSEDQLVERYLAPARVCLGVFGASAKAARVVPAKVWLALAAGRAVITRDSLAAREQLGLDHAVLCRPADGEALAAAIRGLCADAARCDRLASAGPPLVARSHSPAALGDRLRVVLEEVLQPGGASGPSGRAR